MGMNITAQVWWARGEPGEGEQVVFAGHAPRVYSMQLQYTRT